MSVPFGGYFVPCDLCGSKNLVFEEHPNTPWLKATCSCTKCWNTKSVDEWIKNDLP